MNDPGGMDDDSFSCRDQLELCWGLAARIRHIDVHPLQLLNSVRPYRVSAKPALAMKVPTNPNRSGIMTYVLVNGTVHIVKIISFGRIRPTDEDSREYWTCMKPLSFMFVKILEVMYLFSPEQTNGMMAPRPGSCVSPSSAIMISGTTTVATRRRSVKDLM
jgi:hypothetical protein